MTFTVFSYDITDDNRRLKVAKVLEGVADRAQRSLFEGYLDDRTLDRTLRRLGKLIDPATDSLRVYRLCATCFRQVQAIGQRPLEQDQKTIVL